MDHENSDEYGPPLQRHEELLDHFRKRQRSEIQARYRKLFEWLRTEGKDPKRSIGYSESGARSKISRIARCHAWVMDRNDSTRRLTREDANRIEKALAENEFKTQQGKDYAESSKRKLLDSLRCLFMYRAHVHGGQPWSPSISFNQIACCTVSKLASKSHKVGTLS